MNDSQLTTLEEVTTFLKVSDRVDFEKVNRPEAYGWIEETLLRFEYYRRSKRERGLIKRYLQKLTGYSRAQVTRLVEKYRNTGRVQVKRYRRYTFPRRYAREEVARLARTDELHNFPNGCALKKILQRMVGVHREPAYRTLAQISVAHLYNLRKTPPTGESPRTTKRRSRGWLISGSGGNRSPTAFPATCEWIPSIREMRG